MLKVVNVVASMRWTGATFPTLREELTRAGIADTDSSAPWIKCRISGNYVAFYKGGRFQTTGASSILQARVRLDDATQTLQRLLPAFTASDFQVKNLVATGTVGRPADLGPVVKAFQTTFQATYEPEQFPAAILRVHPATILLYASGSVVVTGIKTMESAEQAIDTVCNALRSRGLLHREPPTEER